MHLGYINWYTCATCSEPFTGETAQALAVLWQSHTASWPLEHPFRLAADHNHARQLKRATRYDEAVNQLMPLRQRFADAYGPDDPRTLSVICDLIVAYSALGRFSSSIPIARHLVATRASTLGTDHLDTIEAQELLASALFSSGEEQEAQRIRASVHDVTLRTLGAAHKRTHSAAAMLANTMNTDATGPLGALLAISIQELGQNHRKTLIDQANMVVALVDLERYREAIAILRTALPAMTSVLGASHPVTVHSRENLGHCHEMICARPDCNTVRE